MITVTCKGDFKKTEKFFGRALKQNYLKDLERFAEQGVRELIQNTPRDTGETAASWNYEIVKTPSGVNIYWTNNNINKGIPIAILLQYGHGTKNGGYVQGIDFINPSLRPVFEQIADSAWKELIE